MSKEYSKSISVNLRVKWKTTKEYAFDDGVTDEVYSVVMGRIEKCLAANVCGQVGAIPGTEKMELTYAVSM